MSSPRHAIGLVIAIAGSFIGTTLAFGASDERPLDVSAQIDSFLEAVSVSTATAKSRSERDVKFLALGFNEDAKVVVQRIAVGYSHSVGFCGLGGVVAVAHVHHKDMTQEPESGDFEAAAAEGCATYVISHNGKKIWEVAVRDGLRVFRLVGDSAQPDWRAHK